MTPHECDGCYNCTCAADDRAEWDAYAGANERTAQRQQRRDDVKLALGGLAALGAIVGVLTSLTWLAVAALALLALGFVTLSLS